MNRRTESTRAVTRERWRLLVHVVRLLEPVMAILGVAWLALVILDLTRGLSPTMTAISRGIWIIFILDFVAELSIAPNKRLYLRKNWIVALSLTLPVLRLARVIRIVRIARAARSIRGLRLVRTLTSLNRGMSSLRTTLSRRGAGYVVALTAMVTLAGAGAMYAFERNVPNPAGIHDYSTSLWWTAMIMTTMGSAYWPETTEGRLLCVLLALYAFTVFGYVTAMLATWFVSRDALSPRGEDEYEQLRRDIAQLRSELRRR